MSEEFNSNRIIKGYELFEYALDKLSDCKKIELDYLNIQLETDEGFAYVLESFKVDIKIPFAYAVISDEGSKFSGAASIENNIIEIGIGDSAELDSSYNKVKIFIDTENETESKRRIDIGIEKFINVIEEGKILDGIFIIGDKEVDLFKESWPYVDDESKQDIIENSQELKNLAINRTNDEAEEIFYYIEKDGCVHLCIVRKSLNFEEYILANNCKTFENEEQYRQYIEEYYEGYNNEEEDNSLLKGFFSSDK